MPGTYIDNSKKRKYMKIHFVTRMQLGFCMAFAGVAVLCFVASFYNGCHVLTGCLSAVMGALAYKEKNWN